MGIPSFLTLPRQVTRNKRSSLGFTLLEMLIVLSIIGILIGLVSVSFSTAQKKSRNARRRADMKSVSSAFEQYYSVVGTYANTCATMASAGTTVILPNGLPQDPKFGGQATGDYVFSCNASTSKYCACALLEDETGNATGVDSAASTCNYAATGGTFYCVSQLQ